MVLDFVKMSGAGNDFIVLDNTAGDLTSFLVEEKIAEVCTRGLSVGADGLLALEKDDTSRFRMRYFNSDGGEAEMCGNGGRCISRFAVSRGLAEMNETFEFVSSAGRHRAMVTGPESARLWMTPPVVHDLNASVQLKGETFSLSFLDTGVPHAVLIGAPEERFDELAPLLRRHDHFGPSGANVDFVFTENDEGFRIRTWERGVEGETLACGTGAVACALVLSLSRGIELPIDLRVRSGQFLRVGSDSMGTWLEGQAREVFQGRMEYSADAT